MQSSSDSKIEQDTDSSIVNVFKAIQDLLNKSRGLDFLGPLVLRLYLVPIFWMAGTKKYEHFESTVDWFGNTEWGLGLPLPDVMAFLATTTEIVGAVFLLVGFAVRWVSIPLMITMLVAIFTVHWPNGWLAIAESTGFFASERTAGAIARLGRAKEILNTHGNYDWLTAYGDIVVLNNGIEFATTYFIMLLVLFFVGAGRYLSIDYWISNRFNSK